MVLIKPCKEAMVRCVEVGIYPAKKLPGKKYTAHILYTVSEIAKNTAHKTHASKKVQHNVCVHDKYPQNHLSLQKHKSGGHRRGKGGGGLKYHT